MSSVQDQAGPGKGKKPRGIEGPPAAPRQEERDPLPASVYPTLSYEGGQTPSDAGQVGFSPPQPAPAHSDREPQPQAVGTAFPGLLDWNKGGRETHRNVPEHHQLPDAIQRFPVAREARRQDEEVVER